MRSLIIWTAVLGLCPCASFGATLVPADVVPFFVTPDAPAKFRWRVEGGKLDGNVDCTLRDYWDKAIATVSAKTPPDGMLEAEATLARGYYTLEVPATKQRFGVVSLPA